MSRTDYSDTLFLFDPVEESEYSYRKLLFANPIDVLILEGPHNRAQFFRKIRELSRDYYLAGFLSYEAGYIFEKKLWRGDTSGFPYALFGVYEKPVDIRRLPEFGIDFRGEYSLSAPTLDMKEDEYVRNIKKILEHIKAGDVYQINFTSKLKFDFSGSASALFYELRRRQRVSYPVFSRFNGNTVLSLSPELFFHYRNGKVIVRPMKGTCRRGRYFHEDSILEKYLKNDLKNQSENVMIVDLMRNDLSRFSIPGSVDTLSLYDIEKYETLFQMTSTVESRPRNENVAEIINYLFPSGSITGAPKIRSMEIIRELEQEERKIYTGSIGYIEPGGSSVFNVAIRTLLIEGNRGEMGAGGGIVYDSVPEREYEEALLKGAFLTSSFPEYKIIETLLLKDGVPVRIDEHFKRLKEAAGFLGFVFRGKEILDELNEIVEKHPMGRYRIRLLISKDGIFEVEISPLNKFKEYRLCLSDTPTDSSSKFLFYKTTERKLYSEKLALAIQSGYYDCVFTNERGEITEGARTNVYLEKDGLLLTPPISSGLLNGIIRDQLLRDGRAREEVLCLSDLNKGKIMISNSLIGLVEACPVLQKKV